MLKSKVIDTIQSKKNEVIRLNRFIRFISGKKVNSSINPILELFEVAGVNYFISGYGKTVIISGNISVNSFNSGLNSNLLESLLELNNKGFELDLESYDYPEYNQRTYKFNWRNDKSGINIYCSIDANLIDADGNATCKRVIKSVEMVEKVTYGFQCN